MMLPGGDRELGLAALADGKVDPLRLLTDGS
jgi:hypothetical protein